MIDHSQYKLSWGSGNFVPEMCSSKAKASSLIDTVKAIACLLYAYPKRRIWFKITWRCAWIELTIKLISLSNKLISKWGLPFFFVVSDRTDDTERWHRDPFNYDKLNNREAANSHGQDVVRHILGLWYKDGLDVYFSLRLCSCYI